MFVILAIFTTGVTYTGDVGGAQANAAPPSTPIPPSTRPFPACEYTLFNQSIVTMAFAAAIAYDLPQNAGNDVLLWLGPQYQIAYQWIEPTLQFYDFRNGNLSIISVRGTADATSALIDMDLWSQIAMFQFVDIVVPLIRVWPIEVTRAIVKFTSIGAWMDDTPLYEPLVDYIQQVQAQGLNVIVTGHSLGGGMASIGGALTGLKSVGYSPPGIVYSSLKFGIQDVYSLDETMISIYAEGDVVPKVDTHYGMQQYIPCEPGSTLACHYITRTILFLQKSCGDPFGRQMIQTYLTPAQIDFINQQTGQPSS
ncbi:hypothetical protein DFJ74DRAFT_10497 [Hyaloraphidium curvatum]|nr:hypothetical protein DFJ74DRAFT_10497 [Hyaloraphidium curvatum]